MPGDDSQVVSLGLNDLDADTDYSAKSKKIVYYPTAGSSKTSSYTLSDNAKFYYNYETSCRRCSFPRKNQGYYFR